MSIGQKMVKTGFALEDIFEVNFSQVSENVYP